MATTLACDPGQTPSPGIKETVDTNASAPGEIRATGAFTTSRGKPTPIDHDTTARCTWLTMTYMDADGTVRVIEIPAGNDIRVTVEETRPDPYAIGVEADLMAIPPQSLSKLFDRGVRTDGTLLRVYGRP